MNKQFYLYIEVLSPHYKPHDILTTPSRHVKNLTTQRWICEVFCEVFYPYMRDANALFACFAYICRRTIRTSRPHDKNNRYALNAKKNAPNQGILAI
jgi:hypothetical protein